MKRRGSLLLWIILFVCILLVFHLCTVKVGAQAIPAVHIESFDMYTFSIYTHSGKLLFDSVRDIRAGNGGLFFLHDGKKKFIMGNVWIEPEPPHGKQVLTEPPKDPPTLWLTPTKRPVKGPTQ
jgi:hypothetical protein